MEEKEAQDREVILRKLAVDILTPLCGLTKSEATFVLLTAKDNLDTYSIVKIPEN